MTDASLAAAVLETAGDKPPVPWPVIEACGLPEIGSQLVGLSVRLDPTLTRPFFFDHATIAIRPDRAATVTGSALILREAIELNAVSPAKPTWADRIVAHATALTMGATSLVGRGEHAAYKAFSPLGDLASKILSLHDQTDAGPSAQAIAVQIAEYLEQRDESPRSCPDDDIHRAARALPFAVSTEVLLSSGGDDRQAIDWATGLCKYGVSPSPAPWTASFGSCTASSPTSRAFEAASRLRRLLIEAALAGDLDRIVEAHGTVMRKTLLAALGVADTSAVEVVFTPSGTDAELVPLLVAMAPGESVHSIIVGQHEIGGGSTLAAVGRHFGDMLPSGSSGRPGEPLTGFDDAAVVTSMVDVRDAQGQLLEPEQVESAVEKAIAKHSDRFRTLVHVVAGSKTGIRLPRPEAVRRWRSLYGDRLDVVVDAAQMRVDPPTAVQHLQSNCMIIVTGSKFFAGPPFSGAVLVPSSLAPRLSKGRQVQPGLADYLTEADVPPALPDLRAAARPGLNAGLLLRWEAAIAEMRSFHNISPEIRAEVLRLLAVGLRRLVDQTPFISLVESPHTPVPDPGHSGLDGMPTIFTFLSLGPDGRPLSMDQCDVVHGMLAQDLYGLVAIDDAVLRRTFQLGRPVKIYERDGDWVGGLRIAIGAPTVSEIVFDHTRARTWTERIERTIADMSDAFRKLGLILEHAHDVTSSPEPQLAR